MLPKYVPILKWKKGEKDCLENLSPNIIKNIMPFIEVPTPSVSAAKESAEKKFNKLISSFNKTWGDNPFFLYLAGSWYDGIDDSNQIHGIYRNFYASIKHSKAIPAFNLIDEANISNANKLSNQNGLCLRIVVKDFEHLNNILDQYIKNSWIMPQSTDLLIDLEYIDDEIYPKKTALTTVLSDVANISDYRSVIIASGSFPKDVSNLQSNVVNEFSRHETSIHNTSLKLQKTFLFNYVYADYGPTYLQAPPYIKGMSPNFKIKYTTSDKYLVVKGLSIKKDGLGLGNVANCCRQLMSHSEYMGATFSYGDKIIADTASGKNVNGGNLTSWVGYSFNHHITLISTLL